MNESPGDVTVAIPRAALGATPHNLPAEMTRFVGRDTDLAHCEVLLGEGRLLTVTGLGGCGKTRFALRLAERVLDRHPGGVWFADLSPLTDPAHVPLVMATAMGLR